MSTNYLKKLISFLSLVVSVTSCSNPDMSTCIYSHHHGDEVIVMEQKKYYVLDHTTNRYELVGFILGDEINNLSDNRIGYWERVKTKSKFRNIIDVKKVGTIADSKPTGFSELIPARNPDGVYQDKVNHKLIINGPGWVFYHHGKEVSAGVVDGPFLYDSEGFFKGYAYYENDDYDNSTISVRIGAQLLFKIVE